jgi:hypothetical protein
MLVIKGQYMRIILNSNLVGFSCILILLEFLVHGLLILTFRDDVAIFRVDDVLVDCILLQTSHNILTEHRHVRKIQQSERNVFSLKRPHTIRKNELQHWHEQYRDNECS